MEKLVDSGTARRRHRRHHDRDLRPPLRRRALRRPGPARRDRAHRHALCRLGRRARHGEFPRLRHGAGAYRDRNLYRHNPQVTLMRTTADGEPRDRRTGSPSGSTAARARCASSSPRRASRRSTRPASRSTTRKPTPRCSTRSRRACAQTDKRRLDPPAAPHQRPGILRRAGRSTFARSQPERRHHMPRIDAQQDPRQSSTTWCAAACRSSAAAPAPAFRRNARRPAASTSSSSTIPAATAWPGAARRRGCSPTATPTRS